MNTKSQRKNHQLIMFIMLWLLLAAIVAGLLIKGQLLLLCVGLAPIGYYISKITIKLLEK